MRAAMPAAIGAARVPRRSFKTAYTSKKTRTMSATLRGSIIRLKYSVYGSSNNISTQLSGPCSSVKSVTKNSTDVFSDRLMSVNLFVGRGLEKYHLHFGLSAFDTLFDLLDRLHHIRRQQIRSHFQVRVNQD